MGELIRKSHNVSIVMYHFVCVAKYRRLVISDEVDHVLRDVCEEISKRYEMRFLEIGTDGDHVHFLIQSVPSYSPSHLIRKLKSITAQEIVSRVPEVQKQLWGGEFWTDGYVVSTVGEHANEDVIGAYIQKHGDTEEYNQLHKEEVTHQQLTLF